MLQARNEAYVIEVDQHDAGVAIREGGVFHFVAADRRYSALERQQYRDVGQVQRAAEALRLRIGPADDHRLAS